MLNDKIQNIQGWIIVNRTNQSVKRRQVTQPLAAQEPEEQDA